MNVYKQLIQQEEQILVELYERLPKGDDRLALEADCDQFRAIREQEARIRALQSRLNKAA